MGTRVAFARGRIGASTARRLAALSALALDLFGLALLALLVIERPLFALAILGGTAVLLAFLFVLLTRVGLQRGGVLTVMALTGIFLFAALVYWGTLSAKPGWFGPTAIACFAIGAGLSRVALRKPPPPTFDLFAIAPADDRPRHPVLIMNPKSGGGSVGKFGLAELARELRIETVLLEPGSDLTELARDAVARGADALAMAGGDGSQALVLSVAVANDLPYVCIPAGTRNHLALDLGLDRTDPRQAFAAFLDPEERRIDYAMVNDHLFVNNVALGVYAAIVEQDSYRDQKVETTLELLPKLAAEGGPWFDLHFDVPEHGRLDHAVLLMVSNNPYDLVNEPGQRHALDTGELGMVTLNPERVTDLVEITMLTAAGKPALSKSVWQWTAPTFRVESDQAELAAGIDGETVTLRTPLEFRIVANGARVLVPKGTRVGLREQLHHARGRHTGLLEVAFNLPER